MCCAGGHFDRSADFHQSGGGVAQSAGSIDHVVHQNDFFAANVADDVHDFGYIGFLAALVNNRKRAADAGGKIAGTGNRAEVGGNHDIIIAVVAHSVFQERRENRSAQQVIHGNVEEALNLRCVQIHGKDPVGSGGGDQISHQLCRNRVAGLGLTVLAGIAEVRNNRGDTGGRSTLHRVDHDEQLHDVVVYRRAGRLHNKTVRAANRFKQRHGNFPVAKGRNL